MTIDDQSLETKSELDCLLHQPIPQHLQTETRSRAMGRLGWALGKRGGQAGGEEKGSVVPGSESRLQVTVTETWRSGGWRGCVGGRQAEEEGDDQGPGRCGQPLPHTL